MIGIRIKGLCVLKGKQMPKGITLVEFHGCTNSAFFCQNNTAKRSYILSFNGVMATDLRKGFLEAHAFKENIHDPVVNSKATLHIGEQVLYLHQRPQSKSVLNTDFLFFFLLLTMSTYYITPFFFY